MSPQERSSCRERTVIKGPVQVTSHCEEKSGADVVTLTVRNEHEDSTARLMSLTLDFCGVPEVIESPRGWKVNVFSYFSSDGPSHVKIRPEGKFKEKHVGVPSGGVLEGVRLRFVGQWRHRCSYLYDLTNTSGPMGVGMVSCTHDFCVSPEK